MLPEGAMEIRELAASENAALSLFIIGSSAAYHHVQPRSGVK
jgi:hypothetical protein